MNLFVRNNVPEVQGLKLLTYKDQVVAGMNYCFTYDSETQPGSRKTEICVWSKPWENNFLQVRRPDGSVIKAGGLDAIPANAISTTINKFF